MLLVERHLIKKNNPFYKELDELSFKSKNLYNYANYLVRQEFISTSKEKQENKREFANYLNYNSINRTLIDNNQFDYINLPRKVSNQTLMKLDKNWKSFFKSIKDFKTNPSKYNGRPSLPKYKHKTKGRSGVIYEKGAISKVRLKSGYIKLSNTNINIKFKNELIKYETVNEVRVIPKADNTYIIEIVYDKDIIDQNLNKKNILGVDIGVNNLMALTSNKKGLQPVIVNGRPLKSINQFFNKELAKLKSNLPEYDKYTSNKIKQLCCKRHWIIDDYLHKTSKFVIDFCIKHNIGTIVIGKNDRNKTSINIGRVNNQNFVSIPFNDLIQKIKYKGLLIGMDVIVREESYTSKASFIDLDEIPTYKENKEGGKCVFSGKRVKRGLYVSKDGILINSDVNGSYNIIRKEFPNEFSDGIEGISIVPIRIKSKNEYNEFLCIQ